MNATFFPLSDGRHVWRSPCRRSYCQCQCNLQGNASPFYSEIFAKDSLIACLFTGTWNWFLSECSMMNDWDKKWHNLASYGNGILTDPIFCVTACVFVCVGGVGSQCDFPLEQAMSSFHFGHCLQLLISLSMHQSRQSDLSVQCALVRGDLGSSE